MEKKHSKDKELLAYVGRKTKTVKLLDKFDETDEKGKQKFDRLVISAVPIYCKGEYLYFHLLVERGNGTNAAGNITFTEYKQGHTNMLVSYLKEELERKDISKFIGADACIYFSKPFILRGQNSSNRHVDGWRWFWPEGNYIKGTNYGETTDYQITGAYISESSMALQLQPSRRREFYWA